MVVVVATVVALALHSGVAFDAGPPASPHASCVATITGDKASQLPPGAAGKEVSGLATSAPGIAGCIVSDRAKAYAGSIDACLEAEG